MKKILILLLLIATSIHCFAQSADSSNNIYRAYKNNIQVGVFAPSGIFALQFEHALSKKISWNITANFKYPYLSNDHPIEYSIELMPQLRWYTQQKKDYNQGFYLSLSMNLVNRQSYSYGSYNPQTGDLRLNSKYIPSGYVYEDNISSQRLSVYMGAGAGYQWLVAKRLIIDVGCTIQYALFDNERFNNIPVQNQWQQVDHDNIYDYLYFPFQINMGYAF